MDRSRWSVVLILLMLAGLPVAAQVNRYIVFFKDKNGSPYSVSNPSAFLSEKALTRRTRQNISVSNDDIPVNENYLQGLRDAGASVFFRTRWMNAALVQCNASLVNAIAGLSFVKAVELVAPNKKLVGGRSATQNGSSQDSMAGSSTRAQLQMIGVDEMHREGYAGEGVTIAVLDAGFPGVNTAIPFHDLIQDSRIDMAVSHDFIANTNNVFQYDSHGTEVLSTIAAYQDGTFTGGAYKANFQLFVTEDVSTEYRIEEYNWLFAAEKADSAGADIITTSLGYNQFDDPSMDYTLADLDGKTSVITRAAQFAADRGIIVVCSAGNEGANGWGLITVPADAADVLAVANVDANGIRSTTSSIGPSADGRIKPDVAALGMNVSVISPSGNPGSASGTSLSAPLVTGLMAGLHQRFPDISNKTLIDAVRKTASQSDKPDQFLGYGIPNFEAVEHYVGFKPLEKILAVHPNPFIDQVTISPRSPAEFSSCYLEIVTVQGKTIAQQLVSFDWTNTSFTADTSNLSAGLYFFKIEMAGKKYVFKMVKR